MATTSATDPSSPMEETPNWLEMPQDLMEMILQRLGAVEMLNRAQKVCTTWRRICKNPAMWKVIDMRNSVDVLDVDYDIEKLAKQAVLRSHGELIDINIECFGTDDLLDHISRCSSQLNCLRLANCYNITSSGLSHAVKRLPHLEKLHLSPTSISVEAIEVIGRSCPMLKSFKMNKECPRPHVESDDDALAIANNMPELRHLQLFGNTMTNNGLQALLHGCPHLISLDLCMCFNLDLGGNLGKLCMEQIKDLKRPNDSTENCGFNPRIHDWSLPDDIVPPYWYSDIDDFFEDNHDDFFEDNHDDFFEDIYLYL